MTTTTKAQLFLLVLILGFLTGPKVMLAIQKLTPEDVALLERSNVATVLASTSTTPLTPTPSPYANLHLQSKNVYVWDITTHRKLFGLNEQVSLPLASVTKMMTAVVAKELLSQTQVVRITADDLQQEGESGLLEGEAWGLTDLLGFTLVASSNDGATAIARVAGESLLPPNERDNSVEAKKMFIEKMNEKARIMGLDSTAFLNESGLDITSTEAGANGSARDMAMLFEYIFRKHPELFTLTTYVKHNFVSRDRVVHTAVNTNPEVAGITGIIGSKTGYTDLAGGNLVVIVDIGINHPVVIAVLGSTRDGRFSDVEELIHATVLEVTKTASSTRP